MLVENSTFEFLMQYKCFRPLLVLIMPYLDSMKSL